jgi:carboxyl-terminal processing protease
MVIPLRVAVALSVVSGLVCLRPVSAQGVPGIAPAARAYLDHVLELLESESLNRARLDWGELRASAYRMAAGAQSPRDTYAAITHVVSSLGDQHSRFVPPIAALAEMAQIPEAALRAVVERPGLEPESRRADARVGYIRVPAFSGRDPADFARRVAERVLEVDGPEVCGWIVDVRGNGGGNMWPMLQGLLPILGEGVPGYFVYPDGEWTAWLVERSVVEGRLSRDRVAVAVLQDEETASSGEAVVVAFRGRPGTDVRPGHGGALHRESDD